MANVFRFEYRDGGVLVVRVADNRPVASVNLEADPPYPPRSIHFTGTRMTEGEVAALLEELAKV